MHQLTPLDQTWQTLQIFYHDHNKDRLILEGLVPHLHALHTSGAIRESLIQRHWLHGPHVRVHLQPSAGHEQQVWSVLDSAVAEYLDRRPSMSPLSETAYLEGYGSIKDVEITQEPMLPLEPDNSWAWHPLLFRGHMYGNTVAAREAMTFLAQAQPVFVTVMEQAAHRKGGRMFALAEMMFVFCSAFAPGPSTRIQATGAAAYSFRSHAEAYFYGLGAAGETLRERCAAQWLQGHDQLAQALDQVLDHTMTSDLQTWHDLVHRTSQRWTADICSGHLHLINGEEMRAVAVTSGNPQGRELPKRGPWHRDFDNPDSLTFQRMLAPDVQARRFLVNLMYERFVFLGLRALDRLFLCFLVAETVERRVFGQVWQTPSTPQSAS